ncbi:MAG: nucleotide exchange factor GrpE [Anaerolineales bacterium]|nr:nucleotide exchange factor GrpE [Anaerolineales bacterium]
MSEKEISIPEQNEVPEQASAVPIEPEQAPQVAEVVEEAPAAPLVEELQNEIARLQAQVEEYKDGWMRSVAELQNFRRRVEREQAEVYQTVLINIIKRYLPLLDDLERALAHRPADLPWADGIELIYRKWQSILESEGIRRIEAEGRPFDPNFHEAIAQEPVEGVESGTVIDVVQQGYLLGERLVRPALVRVAQ